MKIKDEIIDDGKKKVNPLSLRFGLKTASTMIEQYSKKRVYYIKPLPLALSFARRDPITGMPGVPMGSILEFAGGPGKGKSLTAEQFMLEILKENDTNKVISFNFEYPDEERWLFLFKDYIVGVPEEEQRVLSLDFSNPELNNAEDGLNIILDIGRKRCEGDPDCQAVICITIDSFGMMATEREIRDKEGNMVSIDKKTQLALRADKIKDFLTRWNTLNPNTRPILFVLNHMIETIEIDGGFGLDPMKVEKIGEDLNFPTSGGKKKNFVFTVRVRNDARKYSRNEAEKHEETGGKCYDALELVYEIYRSKLLPGRHWARAIYNMEDRKNCHFEEELDLLGVCSYLGVGNIIKLPRNKWKISDVEMSEEKAKIFLKERPELMRELIIECAKPGNPERYHAPKGKKEIAGRSFVDADQIL